MIFLELFITFFIIGAFTFGGGYAMLSLIQNQVVTVHQWLTPEEFTDIVAISQMSPGPIGINSATYIGYSATPSASWARSQPLSQWSSPPTCWCCGSASSSRNSGATDTSPPF